MLKLIARINKTTLINISQSPSIFNTEHLIKNFKILLDFIKKDNRILKIGKLFLKMIEKIIKNALEIFIS
jgi:hypothetical protein